MTDRNQCIHSRGPEHLGDVIVGAQDDHFSTPAIDDLGADQQLLGPDVLVFYNDSAVTLIYTLSLHRALANLMKRSFKNLDECGGGLMIGGWPSGGSRRGNSGPQLASGLDFDLFSGR